MVDWKSSGIPLISSILGSFVLFGVSTFYEDYVKEAQIVVDTYSSGPRIFEDLNRTLMYRVYEIDAGIQNLGNSPATELILKPKTSYPFVAINDSLI